MQERRGNQSRQSLARADAEAQAVWLRETLHQTWARVGVQPRVDTFGMRKTAPLFGALSLEARPRFHYQFAPVFNAQTSFEFLKRLVRRS